MTLQSPHTAELLDAWRLQLPLLKQLEEQASDLLQKAVKEQNIQLNTFEHRMKSEESLTGKLEKKGYKYNTIYDITDLVGIRVVTYYTDDVEKYMQMSDLIVTKPGGLTVTEAIATGLPMAIFKAIPGQEVQNADFLVRNGMAVKINKDKTCTDIITDLLSNRDKLAAMRAAVKNHSNGDSAAKVYALMEKLIQKYRDNEKN